MTAYINLPYNFFVSDLEHPDSTPEHGEGSSSHQPINVEPKAHKVTPQMILVCCWRSMKEVSLLMGLLASSAPVTVNDSKPGLISPQQVRPISAGTKTGKQMEQSTMFFQRYAGTPYLPIALMCHLSTYDVIYFLSLFSPFPLKNNKTNLLNISHCDMRSIIIHH